MILVDDKPLSLLYQRINEAESCYFSWRQTVPIENFPTSCKKTTTHDIIQYPFHCVNVPEVNTLKCLSGYIIVSNLLRVGKGEGDDGRERKGGWVIIPMTVNPKMTFLCLFPIGCRLKPIHLTLVATVNCDYTLDLLIFVSRLILWV